MAKRSKVLEAPQFLIDLLNARSPSGHEFEAQAVFDRYMQPYADTYNQDAMGNRMATLNPKGDPVVMLAGHMDELGLMVHYVDEHGFIYVETLGGHDMCILPGRRVRILTENGTVSGVVGKRALHLMTAKERETLPKLHEVWVDIGVSSQKEALKLVRIGDPIVYDHQFERLQGSLATARAFDNKAGCYIAGEVMRRLAKTKTLKAQVVAVATSQEEVGVRGATVAAYAVNPHIAIAIDVNHATDHPDCDKRKFGQTFLGKGPILDRGPNINPKLLEQLIACAKAHDIPYQLYAEPRPTGTDARVMQVARQGAAAAVVGIPLRYMHTPSEIVDLQDIEYCVQLLVAFVQGLKKGEYYHY